MKQSASRFSGKDRYRAERIGLTVRKCFAGVLLLLLMLLPVWYEIYMKSPAPEPTSCKVLLLETNRSAEGSYCKVTLTFKRPVHPGTATVAFYDEKGRLIGYQPVSLFPELPGRRTAAGICYVGGMVDRGDVIDADFDVYTTLNGGMLIVYYLFLISLFLFPWPWIRCFACKYRTYTLNGHCILIYAGFSRTTVRMDGRMLDEVIRAALFSATRLRAVLDGGTTLDVTVSPTLKRIRLHVNNRPVKPD